MILAVTLIVGALATYWATATAGTRGGGARARRLRILRRRCWSPQCSAASCMRWARFGRSLPILRHPRTAMSGTMFFTHGWFWWGRSCRSLLVPAAYAAANTLQNGLQLSDRWRTYGFPSIVASIYVALNVISFVTDEIGGWSQVSLWNYALLPMHCLAVFASWIVYLGGMDRFVARRDHGRLSAC